MSNVAAAPVAPVARPGIDIFMQGEQLVVRHGTVLPDLCIATGAPTGGSIVANRKLQWVPPWIGILFVLSPLIGLIVRKNGTLSYYVSAEQKARRKNGILIGLGAIGASFLFFVIAGAADVPALAILGGLGFLAGIIVAIVVGQPFQVRKIDKEYIYLKVKPPFAAAIQPYLVPAAAPAGYGQAPAGYAQAPAGYAQTPAGYGHPPQY